MSWESICLRFILIVYSNFLAIASHKPALSYAALNNFELSKMTGYYKSLWETLGKGTLILCLLDLKYVRCEVRKVKALKKSPGKFTEEKRRMVKNVCRKKLKTIVNSRKPPEILSDFKIIFPNLFRSL